MEDKRFREGVGGLVARKTKRRGVSEKRTRFEQRTETVRNTGPTPSLPAFFLAPFRPERPLGLFKGSFKGLTKC